MARIQHSPYAVNIASLCAERWDVLIIGGGIVGAGVARDAAMRGLRTALVEQHDFAFGTSSRSSRLLHGGLRYLAQGRVGMVRQSSIEKCTVHRIAPHLSAPLPFLFPTYRHTSWVRWQLSIGVRIYDFLCGQRNLGPCSTLSAVEMAEKLPGINRCDLTGGVRYYDGLTNDARLVVDTLQSAARTARRCATIPGFWMPSERPAVGRVGCATKRAKGKWKPTAAWWSTRPGAGRLPSRTAASGFG